MGNRAFAYGQRQQQAEQPGEHGITPLALQLAERPGRLRRDEDRLGEQPEREQGQPEQRPAIDPQGGHQPRAMGQRNESDQGGEQ